MGFVVAKAGRERWGRRTRIPRHRHEHGYAAIVLDGGYVEIGDRGRLYLAAGDVAFHSGFEAHEDQFGSTGAEIFNLRLPSWRIPSFSVGRITDPDAVVQRAERDPAEAIASLMSALSPRAPHLSDWVDELAAALLQDQAISLTKWARSRGLAPETLSRRFRHVFGMSPSRFRTEARARRAWQSLCENEEPLACVALAMGFSDQAHMTRAVRALTGRTPGAWRTLHSPEILHRS